MNAPTNPPNVGSGAKLNEAAQRDAAIAEFFQTATAFLKKLEPLIDLAIAAEKEQRQ